MPRARAAAMMVGLAMLAGPAFADNNFPPARYDIGGETIEEVIENVRAIWGFDVQLMPVPISQVGGRCANVWIASYSTPWPPAPPGERFVGCLIREPSPVIIYAEEPEWAVRTLRHEAGHLLGWPDDHPQD